MSTLTQPTGQRIPGHTLHGSETAVLVRSTNIWRTIGSVFLSIVKWLVIGLLALVAAALVAISIVWGPPSLIVSLPLAALWVGLAGLLALGSTRFGRGRTQLAAALGFVALGLLTVLASQLSAYTPPIVDAWGSPVPGSIATMETVNLNGTDQWITIRGTSATNPVLLWLAGGPGGSELATVRYHLGGLEDHLVVVNWEQPGAGKSYHAISHAALTSERYIADGFALVQYLKQRFGQEKIYLAGESWGSALGIWLVQRYPEQFYAFIGTGQMVDFVETEVFDYQFALTLAGERGNTQKMVDLTRQGPPPYYGDGVTLKQAAYMTDGFAYMNSDPVIANDDGFNTFQDLLSPEYGLYDKMNWALGILDSGNVMFPQLWQADVDFRRDAPSLQVPVYFLIGRHDINAPPGLAEAYYQQLQAPRKSWVWFERSGHNPWVTESARFVDVVVNTVLAETK